MALIVCFRCKEEKDDHADFYHYKSGITPGKRHAYCKKCHNKMVVASSKKHKNDERRERGREFQREARKLRPEVFRRAERNKKLKPFGKDHTWYEETLAEQGGVCAICRLPETTVDDRTGKTKCLAIDHNHATNRVRGLLCRFCNTNLHSVETMAHWPELAAAYLAKHSQPR